MATSALAGTNILVVEDEMLILMSLEQMLLEHGCESVTLAASVNQALQRIDAAPFDAATLDLNLNGATSFPIAAALAEKGVPFLFMTGYSDRYSKGPHCDRPVLTKPIQETELIRVLSSLMENRGRQVV